MPFQTVIAPSSSTSDYTRNSSDSITTSGNFAGQPGTIPIAVPNQVGMKLSWSGDILKLKSTMNISQSIPAQNATMTGRVEMEIRLKKRP
ncbi:MAG: hypothetical protein EOO88_58340 [Pedobacter sp.]|nr:MAG: hypothetical protein EOO88_58340 [Pedobacter sp.]